MSSELDKEKLEKIMKEMLKHLDGLSVQESINILLNLDRAIRQTSFVQVDRCQGHDYETKLRLFR